jgi:hypothetical protein
MGAESGRRLRVGRLRRRAAALLVAVLLAAAMGKPEKRLELALVLLFSFFVLFSCLLI